MADRYPVPQGHATINAFSTASRLRSFVYAGRGIRAVVTSQHNAWIHSVATFAAVALGLSLRIPRLEWIAIVFAIVSVWTAEAINTALELLCDVASPNFHPLVETAKDVAAGAVLICAIGATVTAVLVFAPCLAMLLP
jgi:diacylglycerol kinase (ATP)